VFEICTNSFFPVQAIAGFTAIFRLHYTSFTAFNIETDKQTRRPRHSVCSNRPHTRRAYVRCGRTYSNCMSTPALLHAPPPPPPAQWTRLISATTTRRNQYDGAGALAFARRRSDVTRCNGIETPPYGLLCANVTPSIIRKCITYRSADRGESSHGHG